MKVNIVSKGFELTPELQTYTTRKIAKLVRRLPHAARPLVDCEIRLTRTVRKEAPRTTCKLIFRIDAVELTASETTEHIYTALDITVADIDQQLREYLHNRWRG